MPNKRQEKKAQKKAQAQQNDPNGNKLQASRSHLLTQLDYLSSRFRPPIMLDSHMHIVSSRGTSMPTFFNRNWVTGSLMALWAKLPFVGQTILPNTRYAVENLDKLAKYGVMTAVVAKYGGITLIPVPLFTKEGIRFMSPAGAAGEAAEKSVQQTATDKSAKLGKQTTLNIGRRFIQEQKKMLNELMNMTEYKNRHLELFGMVMPMDMEYGHIDGYFGIRIYNGIYEQSDKDKKFPKYYWYPFHGLTNQLFGGKGGDYRPTMDVWNRETKTPGELEAPGSDVKNIKKAGGTVIDYTSESTKRYDPYRTKVKIQFTPCLLNKKETQTYELWNKQVKQTELAVMTGGLNLLSLYHYDPRRWEEVCRDKGGRAVGKANPGNVEPFTKVTEGLYAGFKTYTAQGYRPYDINRLPVLEDFYRRCEQDQIPIMNHCTPGGLFTPDKGEYFYFNHPEDQPSDDVKSKSSYMPPENPYAGFDGYIPMPNAEQYFYDNFVSPEAWEPVLKKYPKLRLCLAHFGGNTKMGREWSKKILEMMRMYANLYADISSSFANNEASKTMLIVPVKQAAGEPAGFRDYFKKIITENQDLKSRFLFGTDWYMTEIDGVGYIKYCKETKEFFDKFDTSLWTRFTLVNPVRFYKFDTPKVLDRIITAIEQVPDLVTEDDKREFGVEKADLTVNVAAMKKKAAYIQSSYKAVVKDFETNK